jgi:hypothetical protein
LLFLVPGIGVTLRVNGTARLRTDLEPQEPFAARGALPTCVIEVRTVSVHTQCPKALVRSHLWDATRHRDPAELPSVGEIMQVVTAGEVDGAAYDRAYPERLRSSLY